MVVGVTGFVAAGKSEVARRLAEKLGALYLDADQIVRDLYRRGGQGFELIQREFGREFVDEKLGQVDRKRLGDLVFADSRELLRLNALIHPLVVSEVKKIVAENAGKFVVLEAFSFERGFLGDLVDKLVFVDCPKGRIVQNAQKTRQMSFERLEVILSHQRKPDLPFETIDNSGDLAQLYENVDRLARTLSEKDS